jgi:hypothetical protein
MSWQAVLKTPPKRRRSKVLRELAKEVINASINETSMKLPDMDKGRLKKLLTELISDMEKVEGEEFDKEFAVLEFDHRDKEDYLNILRETRENIPEAREIDKPYLAEKIQEFLDGNHDTLLQLIATTKRKGLISDIREWNKKHGHELSEYIAAQDNEELSEKMTKVFRKLTPLSTRGREVSAETIDENLILAYVKMIVDDLKLQKVGNEQVVGKSSYLPIRESVNVKYSLKLYGLHTKQTYNQLPPATEYILKNSSLRLEDFPAVADTKSSMKKEMILNKLRNNEYRDTKNESLEELQSLFNNSETIADFEREVHASEKMSETFNSLIKELKPGAAKEARYSIPTNIWEQIMSGEYDESLEPYNINDDYQLEDFLEENREALERMEEKQTGFKRITNPEDVKTLTENEEVNLWEPDGSLKSFSSKTMAGGAFSQYLDKLQSIDKPRMSLYLAADGNKNQAVLSDLVLFLQRAEVTYFDRGSEIKQAVVKYATEPTEENKELIEQTLSQAKYSEIRDKIIEEIQNKIVTMLKPPIDSFYLHERETIEPIEWLEERI